MVKEPQLSRQVDVVILLDWPLCSESMVGFSYPSLDVFLCVSSLTDSAANICKDINVQSRVLRCQYPVYFLDLF